jgi:hypothetical protein
MSGVIAAFDTHAVWQVVLGIGAVVITVVISAPPRHFGLPRTLRGSPFRR